MLKLAPAGVGEYQKIAELYERAFPAEERRPLEPLFADCSGCASVLSACSDGFFCGFLCTLQWEDLLHIIYFAVEEDLRGKGLGSEILRQLHAENPGMRVLVDIEEPTPSSENYAQRLKRKSFYLRGGYEENEIHYCWRGVDYTILSYGGAVTNEEFDAFWDALTAAMPKLREY